MRKQLSPEELEKKLKDIKFMSMHFDLIHIPVVITDPDGYVLFLNRATESVTGYTSKEAVGANVGDLWGGNEGEEYFTHMWHLIKDKKQTFTGKIKNKKKDGTFYYQQINISPVLDENGEIEYYISVEPDITADVQADKMLSDQVGDFFQSARSRELKMIELKKEIEKLTSKSQSN